MEHTGRDIGARSVAARRDDPLVPLLALRLLGIAIFGISAPRAILSLIELGLAIYDTIAHSTAPLLLTDGVFEGGRRWLSGEGGAGRRVRSRWCCGLYRFF